MDSFTQINGGTLQIGRHPPPAQSPAASLIGRSTFDRSDTITYGGVDQQFWNCYHRRRHARLTAANTYSREPRHDAGIVSVSADDDLGHRPASPATNITLMCGELLVTVSFALNTNRRLRLAAAARRSTPPRLDVHHRRRQPRKAPRHQAPTRVRHTSWRDNCQPRRTSGRRPADWQRRHRRRYLTPVRSATAPRWFSTILIHVLINSAIKRARSSPEPGPVQLILSAATPTPAARALPAACFPSPPTTISEPRRIASYQRHTHRRRAVGDFVAGAQHQSPTVDRRRWRRRDARCFHRIDTDCESHDLRSRQIEQGPQRQHGSSAWRQQLQRHQHHRRHAAGRQWRHRRDTWYGHSLRQRCPGLRSQRHTHAKHRDQRHRLAHRRRRHADPLGLLTLTLGGTTITVGTLSISADNNLGAAPGSPAINVTFGSGGNLWPPPTSPPTPTAP